MINAKNAARRSINQFNHAVRKFSIYTALPESGPHILQKFSLFRKDIFF